MQYLVAAALLTVLMAGSGTPSAAAATATPTPTPPPLNRIAPLANVGDLLATPTPAPAAPAPVPDNRLSRPVNVDQLNATGITVVPTATRPPDQKLPAPGASNVTLPSPPSPPDAQIQRGGPSDASRDVALATPDYLQPGDHEMDFTPSMVLQRGRDTKHNEVSDLVAVPCYGDNNPSDPGSTLVGWAQGLGPGQCETLVSETAVRFDISQLLQGGPKVVTSAQLTMSEAPWKWTDGDGYDRTVAGCVAAVGVASTDFVADPPTGNDLYSNDTYVDLTPSAATQFDVRVPVEDWFSPDSPRYGFVLKGSIEDLQNDDQSSCMSEISNVQLVVDYTVL